MDELEVHGLRFWNGILSFLVEISMLAAFCLGGLRLGSTTVSHLIGGIGIPCAVIFFWGRYMAPKSRRRIGWPWRQLIALALCGTASWLLYKAGWECWALVLAVIAALNVLMLLMLRQ